MRYFIVLLAITAALTSGCANEGKAQNDKKSSDTISQKLSGVVLSDPLTENVATLKACDDEKATAAYTSSFEANAKAAGKLWEQCQSIYACSPTARRLVHGWFESEATFQLGFGDLKKLGVSSLGEKVGGIYVSGTSTVYLDTSIEHLPQACALLLHELVHRFDPVAYSGVENLKTEYRAYWHQTSFTEELYLNEGKLGLEVRAQSAEPDGAQIGVANRLIVRPTTRRTLLSVVARAYGFEIDKSILERYEPLPIESRNP